MRSFLGGGGGSCSIWPDVEVTEAVQPQVMVPLWATVPGLVGEGGPSLEECFLLLAAAA